MREINKISEYELDSSEINIAMLEYLQREKKLHKAIVYFVEHVKQLGNVSRVRINNEKKGGGLTATIRVGEMDGKIPVFMENDETLDMSDQKRQPLGFKRKNLGLFKELLDYLAKQKKLRKKTVTFDDAYAHITKKFPDLSERYFMIYASDKRQQEKKGYKFDGQRRLFIL